MAAKNDAASKSPSNPPSSARVVEGAPLVTPTADAPSTSGATTTPTSDPNTGNESQDSSSPWSNYPWPPNDDGKACSAPHLEAAGGRQVMVVLGDSHIRNASGALRSSLRDSGFEPVFVCWGGKTTQWGNSQITQMRDMHILPQCLVINLGTNDVKNDAVSADELTGRLADLLDNTGDVAHVVLVNIWANTALAPSTMKNVSDTISSYQQAVESAGNVSLVEWAQQARGNPGLVGDDGVHDTSDGEMVRTQLITEAVSANCNA